MKSFFLSTIAATALAGNWSTANNRLYYNGIETVLHGFSTTCTEYLLRGVGMKCWASYTWNDPSTIIENLDTKTLDAVKGYFEQIKNAGVKPAIRVPMTASNWLGVVTNASKANMDKYPNLSKQYQTMISKIVEELTAIGAVVILDLHWSDDDTEQQAMPLKAKAGTGGAIEFWDSVSAMFKDNDHVFYELYNEPHNNSNDTFINGNGTYAGMLEMIKAVRNNSPDQMLVIAGANDYAYDAQSLIELEGKTNDELIMWNFHPYMGQTQAGDKKKTADGFENIVKQVQAGTSKPVIITEFGQFCCDTDGSCFDYNGNWDGHNIGYSEAIIRISQKYGVSWTPWSWRPMAPDYESHACQDVNGDGTGLGLAHPTDGKGADWLTLWKQYADKPADSASVMSDFFIQQ